QRDVEHARIAAVQEYTGHLGGAAHAHAEAGLVRRQVHRYADRGVLLQPLVTDAKTVLAVDRAEERVVWILGEPRLHELRRNGAELFGLVAGAAHAAIAVERLLGEQRSAALLEGEIAERLTGAGAARRERDRDRDRDRSQQR